MAQHSTSSPLLSRSSYPQLGEWFLKSAMMIQFSVVGWMRWRVVGLSGGGGGGGGGGRLDVENLQVVVWQDKFYSKKFCLTCSGSLDFNGGMVFLTRVTTPPLLLLSRSCRWVSYPRTLNLWFWSSVFFWRTTSAFQCASLSFESPVALLRPPLATREPEWQSVAWGGPLWG